MTDLAAGRRFLAGRARHACARCSTRGVNAPVTHQRRPAVRRRRRAAACASRRATRARPRRSWNGRADARRRPDRGRYPYALAQRRDGRRHAASAPCASTGAPALMDGRSLGRSFARGADARRDASSRARFHARAGVDRRSSARRPRRVGEPRRVALTGGCFQNARLTEATIAALRAAGFAPVSGIERVPPNDGGIALGQAVWAARTIERGAAPCA